MRRFLAGSLIGAVVAAVVAGSVYSATSLLYISGTLSPNHLLMATPDGFGAIDSGVVVAPRLFQLTWGPGQNLATNTLPMGQVGTASTAATIVCIVGSVAAGGTASFDVWYAASGTALGSGTKISTTSCNANGTPNTSQTMFSGSVAIPANSFFGVVATGFGSGATSGSGMVQMALTTP